MRLSPYEKLTQLALYTPYILNEKSVSILVIAKPEHFKTETLLMFRNCKGVYYTTDCTYMELKQHILPRVKGHDIKTVCIPDFLKPIQKKHSTSNNFITLMNSIIEEGYRDQYGQDLRFNLITSLTPDLLSDKRHSWNKIGFLSRCVPFSYSYSEEAKNMIFDDIKAEKANATTIDLKFPELVKVDIPYNLSEQLEKYARILGEKEKLIGFRHLRQFITLAKASALYNNRQVVTQDDVDVITKLWKWINYDMEIII